MVSIVLGIVLALGGLPQVGAAKVPTPAQLETATEFYLRYRTVVATATSMDDVVGLWVAGAADEYKSAPPEQRVDLATVKRMNDRVSNVTVVNEALRVGPGTADATLTLEGTGANQAKLTGTARVAKEKGEWKLVAPEQWK